REPAEKPGRYSIAHATAPRHQGRREFARTDDQRIRLAAPGADQPRQLPRVVLTVRIEGHHGFAGRPKSGPKTAPERLAFAPVGGMLENASTCLCGHPRGGISRAIIDHQDALEPGCADAADHVADCTFGLVGRYDRPDHALY